MARGLDHIVHAVRDLDAAAELYRRMGFTVGARNRHPWGTHNYLVQFPGFFIELLTLAEPDKLGNDGFSRLFGEFTRDFLSQQEGLAILILESRDSAADQRAFSEAGVSASETMRFEREGKRPDGSPVKVAFSLAFAEDKSAAQIHFATCQQHYPENFWNPAFQTHDNGAVAVAGVVMVAGKPIEHRHFISSFTGVEAVRASASRVSAETPRGEIAVLDPVGFRSAFGSAAPSVTGGARLAALQLTVKDTAAAEELLRKNNVAFSVAAGQIVIGAGTAMGATIVLKDAEKTPASRGTSPGR